MKPPGVTHLGPVPSEGPLMIMLWILTFCEGRV